MNKKRLSEHLEKLVAFKIAADLKSIHKAASRLGITQPAVSRTIKVLENVLECQLIKRESKGIRLTEDGFRLYDYAKLIEKSIVDFDPSSKLITPQLRPLKIATYDNIACGIISDLGKLLTTGLPQLSISVGGPNSKILGDLIGGKFDCAFIAEPRILTGLVYKKLFTERYGLFIARNLFLKSDLSKKEVLRIQDLKDFKIIAMPDAIAGKNKNIDRLLWEIGLKSVISIDSYEVAKQLVRDGHGIGIMPFSTACRDIRDNLIIEIVTKDIPRTTFGRHDLTLCWNSKEGHFEIYLFEKMMVDFFKKIQI